MCPAQERGSAIYMHSSLYQLPTALTALSSGPFPLLGYKHLEASKHILLLTVIIPGHSSVPVIAGSGEVHVT